MIGKHHSKIFHILCTRMYEFLVTVKRPVTLRGRQALQTRKATELPNVKDQPLHVLSLYTTKLYTRTSSRCIVVL
uniref:Putative ovule protein n=1 Tax=Solanum chacoense TaxID=4108 RepID=A0A0V0GED1_SOLCH